VSLLHKHAYISPPKHRPSFNFRSFVFARSILLGQHALGRQLTIMMRPAVKVSVTLLSDEDVPASFDVISRSFGHDAPFIDMYFPHHDTPSGQAKGSKRLAAWKQASSNSTFLKAAAQAVDGNEERVIGIGVWTFMKEAPPADVAKVENVEEVWPEAGDREFMSRLWRDYVQPRTQAIQNSNGKGVYGM